MGDTSKADWSLINEAADQFERDWKAGSRPQIEDFIARVEEPQRGRLLDELLRVERELRRRETNQPTAEEYRRRFPEHLGVVDSVFAPESLESNGSGESPGAGSAPVAAPAARASAAIPAELAEHPDYQIIRELAHGGMGVVFLAHNLIMGRDEVLKVIGRDIIERPGVLDRFRREIRAVARLQHPNIVTAYSAFPAGASLVLAMEYVEGLDLARMVKARGPMPVAHACYFVYQAALGLQHAHEAGLVHRDITPGNLMLTREGGRAVIKVLDFGLAKAGREQGVVDFGPPGASHQPGAATSLTLAGQMLGTPDFIAPEQIGDAQGADIRADIYSLGCTLYYLLRGCPPFQATNLADVLQAHYTTDAMPLNLARPEVPVELAAMVAKMMAKEPDHRFQTPAEVAQALIPIFKKQSAASASSNIDVYPAVAPDAGLEASEPRRPGTEELAAPAPAPAAGAKRGMWSSLVEFKETKEDSARVAAAAEPVGDRRRRLRPIVVGAVGFAAILLVLVIIFVFKGRPKPVNDRGDSLAAREPGGGAAEKGTSIEREREPQAQPVDHPQPSPDAPAPTPVDPPIAASPPKASPPAPGVDAGKTPSQPPMQQAKVPAREKEKLIVAAPAFGEQVEHAIHAGVGFLKGLQHDDGSWSDVENEAKTGETSLVTLALVTAGEKPDSLAVGKALRYLRGFGPNDLRSTYAISLQTMVFAAAEPEVDQQRLVANVDWLTKAQLKRVDSSPWPGSWTYADWNRSRPGDNSNTQYALLALFTASEAGVPVKPEVWTLARAYWESGQQTNGGWAYTPHLKGPSASMTCAGISSLIISGLRPFQSQEIVRGAVIRNCGQGRVNPNLKAGIDWLATHFDVKQNIGSGQQWKFYYLYGLERVGRLAGLRFVGEHDWYLRGAEELVQQQNKKLGYWQGALMEQDKALATSFALLFLAKGRTPVLINKLRHGPAGDWDNDPDDIRNIVSIVSRDWKHLLTWQVIDPHVAKVSELLQAPIIFLNGHRAPEFSKIARQKLRKYVDKGGFLFAEACCGKSQFDQGLTALMKEIFPEEQCKLSRLSAEHPVWRAKHRLSPDIHPLWAIENGGRTVVIYSPKDVSCYWNQSAPSPGTTAINAIKVGQNVIDYVTGRRLPPDKLFDQSSADDADPSR